MATIKFKLLKLTSEGERYLAELAKLESMVIKVGFQAGDGEYEDGTDIVDVAAYNEFGTSTIPARPFMKQSWENHKNDLVKVCQLANQTLLQGGTAAQVSAMIGAEGVSVIQQEIVDGQFEPNAASTIRKKGSDRPLIDTGTMRQSVHYVIEEA